MKIVEAEPKDMLSVRELFRGYQAWLGVDLCFHDFEKELATLPGRYSPPKGAIFIAIEDAGAIGCVGIRPRLDNVAELKRLYVQPSYQGSGIGKRLLHIAMSKARKIGYASVVLSTLSTMHTARSLYLSYGFTEMPACYENPEAGAECYRYVFS